MTNTAAAAPTTTAFLKAAIAARAEVRRTSALAHNGILYGVLSLEDCTDAIRVIRRPLLDGDRDEAIAEARRVLMPPTAYRDEVAHFQAVALGTAFVEWFEAHIPA